MPRKPPPEHSRFKPGQSGNPAGSKPLSKEAKEFRRLSQHRFIELVNKYLGMDRETLKAAAQDPKATTLDLIILKVIQQAIEKGDQVRLEFILNRLIGKIPDKIETSLDPALLEAFEKLKDKSQDELLAIVNRQRLQST